MSLGPYFFPLVRIAMTCICARREVYWFSAGTCPPEIAERVSHLLRSGLGLEDIIKNVKSSKGVQAAKATAPTCHSNLDETSNAGLCKIGTVTGYSHGPRILFRGAV